MYNLETFVTQHSSVTAVSTDATVAVWLWVLLIALVKIAIILPIVQGSVAYLVWLERKMLGRIQQRFGPYRVGYQGLLQPIADGLKLFLKEDIIPTNADRVLFIAAPLLTLFTSTIAIAVIPFGPSLVIPGINIDFGALQIADPKIGILYIFAVTSVGVYGIFFAGWASSNKYSLLGALRSSAQMFSYELSLGLSIVPILMAAGTFQMSQIVASQDGGFWHWWIFSPSWLVIPGIIGFFTFYISIFAETNRLPFDLPEAETELVAGYSTEYSSMKFALFFMAEYTAMISATSIATTLFLGGWQSPLPMLPDSTLWFILKTFILLFIFIWVRGTFPRFRYDQLMGFGWKILLPVSLVNVFLAAVGIFIANWVGF